MIYLATYEPGGSLYNREREHILGRSLLNFGLMKEYGRTWEVEQETGSNHVLRVQRTWNLISAIQGGLVVCAVADRALGVDTERIRPFKEGLMRRVCSESERGFVLEGRSEAARQERFFRLWTLKESFVKAIGRGLAFSAGGHYIFTGGGRCKGSIPGWRFYQSRVYQSYIILRLRGG
ncbi:MAG: 4'-phosphopantetheinyl transferase family protein [Enterocloster clostridioformis]